MSGWSDAGLNRNAARLASEAELVCPVCGEENSPHLWRIFVNERGNAACHSCGHTGPRQTFVRKERPAC